MPRSARIAPGGVVYHALNRAVARLPLFEKEGDYEAFERVVQETHQRTPTRILAYCVMPNHWHFVLRPKGDGELTRFLRWLTHTHTMRWHAHHSHDRHGPPVPGAVQGDSRRVRGASLHGIALRGAKRRASQPCRARRGLDVVKRVAAHTRQRQGQVPAFPLADRLAARLARQGESTTHRPGTRGDSSVRDPWYALRHRAMAQEHSGTSRLEPHTPFSRATPETEELSRVPFPGPRQPCSSPDCSAAGGASHGGEAAGTWGRRSAP
jgi:REP element-mobilizing transposase RayT